jgi:hypothetical protein
VKKQILITQETRHRILAAYRLFGFFYEDARSHPYSWDGAIFLTSDTNREKSYLTGEKVKLMKEYQDILSKDGLMLVKKYKVDYILAVDKKDDTLIKRLTDSGHEKVYNDGRYSIIKIGRR